jgi:hypothetical protein
MLIPPYPALPPRPIRAASDNERIVLPLLPLPFQGEGDLNIGRTAVRPYGTPSPLRGTRGEGGDPVFDVALVVPAPNLNHLRTHDTLEVGSPSMKTKYIIYERIIFRG